MSISQGFKIQNFHEFQISMVVFKYFYKKIVDPHHPKDQINPLFLWSSNANLQIKDMLDHLYYKNLVLTKPCV
jgi:hypothetical protein